MRKIEDDFLTPELTPLIDVVFILLIFFLVSSVFKKEELALLLNLPATESTVATSKNKNEINIEVSRTGYALNGKKMTIEEISSIVQDAKKGVLVNLRGDKNSPYNRIIKILDLLQKNRVTNISLITQSK